MKNGKLYGVTGSWRDRLLGYNAEGVAELHIYIAGRRRRNYAAPRYGALAAELVRKGPDLATTAQFGSMRVKSQSNSGGGKKRASVNKAH